MYFLFSGEGKTDLGRARADADVCEGEDYDFGPMAVMVDQIFDANFNYSILDSGQCGFVSKRKLSARKIELNPGRGALKLPGPNRKKDTLYFYNNARVLARIAKERENERNTTVVAILFRDSDGTKSSDPNLWPDKVRSMIRGFTEENYERGVPMVPKPKSEAWILCGLKHGHLNCNSLENRSGNDNSPNSLKKELKKHYGGKLPSKEVLNQIVRDRQVDVDQLKMTSFTKFRTRLEEVINNIDS